MRRQSESGMIESSNTGIVNIRKKEKKYRAQPSDLLNMDWVREKFKKIIMLLYL